MKLIAIIAMMCSLYADTEVSTIKDTSFIEQDHQESFRLDFVKLLGEAIQYNLIIIEPESRFPQATVLKYDIETEDYYIITCDFVRTDSGRKKTNKISRGKYKKILSKVNALFERSEGEPISEKNDLDEYYSTSIFVYVKRNDDQKKEWKSLKISLNEKASVDVIDFFKELYGEKFKLNHPEDPWSDSSEKNND